MEIVEDVGMNNSAVTNFFESTLDRMLHQKQMLFIRVRW